VILQELQDNFDDNSFDTAKWAANIAGGGTVTEQNQRLELAGNSGEIPFVSSANQYDLTASYAYVRVSNWTSGDSVFVELLDPSSDIYGFSIDADALSFFGPSFNGTPITYDPADHAWLRVRESGGTVFADTATLSASDPPSSWTNRWSTAITGVYDKTAVSVRFSVIFSDTARAVYFDGFNTGTSPRPFYRLIFQ
jgi:hypothetical protein